MLPAYLDAVAVPANCVPILYKRKVNMDSVNSLDSVVFLSLAEDAHIAQHLPGIDFSIPLPVQKSSADARFDPAELTVEMIMAGILTVLAYDIENGHNPYYRKLLEGIRPNIKQELCEAAVFKARNEDFDIAEELFQALRGYAPDDVAVILNSALFYDEYAESYRRSGLSEDADACDDLAFSFYQKALAAEPPAPDVFFNAGFFFLKQRNFPRARNCFETYLTLTAADDESSLDENSRYKRERAREIVDDISNRDLEDERFKAAYEFISMGQEEKGLEQIKAFLEKNPQVWNAWFLLGWGLRRLCRWSDARAAFEKADELGGGTADTYNELAICCMETGDFHAARDYLQQALVIEGDNTKIISNLGFLALREGKKDEAAGFFRTVLEIAPDDKIAAAELEKLS